jgi:hypothetical protein
MPTDIELLKKLNSLLPPEKRKDRSYAMAVKSCVLIWLINKYS